MKLIITLNEIKNNIIIVLTLFSATIIFFIPLARADNLGVRGAIYTIAEPDMLIGIHSKLMAMQKSGALKEEEKAVIARTVSHVLRPNPVAGVTDLPKGEKARSHFFNPSVRLNKDITDLEGNVIASKGEVINPLNSMHFDETLIFINADNAEQLHWVQSLEKKYVNQNKRYKIILVNGNIKTTSHFLQHRVYFDQYGKLSSRFSIQHTPTLVFQPMLHQVHVKKLMVKEIKIA